MFEQKRFKNRQQAGEELAEHLHAYNWNKNGVVLGLPRGGVPVAYIVAKNCHLPLDVMLVRKLGLPGHEEFAMGAIASGGARFLQDSVVQDYAIAPDVLESVSSAALAEIERREKLYRAGRDSLQLEGKVVILVDDGLATGSTMKAAVMAVRKARPAKLIVAVPVGAADSLAMLRPLVDDLVCLHAPATFYAVSTWYEHFDQTSDSEVLHFLEAAQREETASAMPKKTVSQTRPTTNG